MTLPRATFPTAGIQEPIRLLLVDDDSHDADYLEGLLRDAGQLTFLVSRAETLDDAQRAVATTPFDIVILDLNLPDSQGLETLSQFRNELSEAVPVFVWIGMDKDKDKGKENGYDPLAPDAVARCTENEPLIRDRLDHRLLPGMLRHALERQRSRVSMRRLIATNPDGIVVVDYEGVVLFANTAASQLFDRPTADLLGESFGFPVVAGSPADINTRTNRVAEMRAVEIDWNGATAFLISLRDVTERFNLVRSLQLARAQAETANMVRNEILSSMSHELRTPLNAIIGFSSMLLTDEGGRISTAANKAYLADIHQSGCHLLELINDVLDVSDIRVGAVDLDEAMVEVDQVVSASLRLVKGRSDRTQIALTASVPAPIPYLFADERRVKQMLAQLLGNAIKFTPAGGTVRLTVERDDQRGLLFTVSDSGPGMDTDQIATALAPFGRLDNVLTSSNSGPGLGLSLVKGMAERHGGSLVIDSTPGVGTLVSLRFPATRVIEGE